MSNFFYSEAKKLIRREERKVRKSETQKKLLALEKVFEESFGMSIDESKYDYEENLTITKSIGEMEKTIIKGNLSKTIKDGHKRSRPNIPSAISLKTRNLSFLTFLY